MARRDEPRIVWRYPDAFQEIRNLEKLKDVLHDYAKVGSAAAGEGFIARAGHQTTRARAAVIAAHPHARNREARDHILMGRALDAMQAYRP
ncbi:hypothetical protein OIE68_15560 [Nocardia vinacea]|uniref:hypothetical protein n=1 Tax=Nocardia vinacea TaxID=96468 RepID=UPI002E0EC31E|nr:hypothetical protein OIE68_15560 [Nocardia vinacea]